MLFFYPMVNIFVFLYVFLDAIDEMFLLWLDL